MKADEFKLVGFGWGNAVEALDRVAACVCYSFLEGQAPDGEAIVVGKDPIRVDAGI